jgi:hypothetical protein
MSENTMREVKFFYPQMKMGMGRKKREFGEYLQMT